MREPTQAEVDAVAYEIFPCLRSYSTADSQTLARAAIVVLDTLRGECVPVDKLKAELDRSHFDSVFGRTDRLIAWLDRKGWFDG